MCAPKSKEKVRDLYKEGIWVRNEEFSFMSCDRLYAEDQFFGIKLLIIAKANQFETYLEI